MTVLLDMYGSFASIMPSTVMGSSFLDSSMAMSSFALLSA